MKIFELVIDENAELHGIDAVSLVENPAIERDFVALHNEQKRVQLAVAEKRMVIGAALVPDMPIYRHDENGGYYIYFSKSTIARLQELFFKNSNHHRATLQHSEPVTGAYVVESWIVEDSERDKTAVYGLNVPRGTWAIGMKIDNEELWENEVKTGNVKGFSIEGFFADAAKLKQRETMSAPTCGSQYEAQQVEEMLSELEQVCKQMPA